MIITPTKTLLDFVDWQNDFILPGWACVPPGAPALPLVPLFNAFLKQLNRQNTDIALFKYDAHFIHEYPLSPEAVPFPNPHCLFGTEGQKLSIELGDLAERIPVFHMNKNEFGMWGSIPVDISRVKFDTPEERLAYQNLFMVTPQFNDLAPGVARDDWFVQQNITPQNTKVVSAGIYADWCGSDAWAGYLTRGFNLTVLTNLCAGIGGTPGRSGADLSGSVESVCQEAFPDALKTGQLKLMTSQHWLASRP
jgi:nicotinamidase-related amidase